MTTKLNMPVFVVGLERLKAQRYQRVLDALTAIGVAATVWPAIDGAQPIKYEPGESVKRFSLIQYAFLGGGLLKTEIACYLSHYRLWKHAFLERDYERVFVFEDDAVFDAARFKAALEDIAKLNQSFEFINLRRRWRGEFKGTPLATDGGHALYAGAYWEMGGCSSYSISRQGFKKLAPALMPIDRPVDTMIRDNSGKVNLRVWAMLPWLCSVDRAVASSIQLRPGWRRRRRPLVKFALLPLRWTYEARITTGWKIARRATAGAPANRFAYAKTLAATLFQIVFIRTKRGPLGALAYRFLRGGVGAIRIETRPRREVILGA